MSSVDSETVIDSSSAVRRDCARCRSSRRVWARVSSSRADSSSRSHFDSERARTFDERGVRGLGFGRALRLCLRRLARIEQASLRRVQKVIGCALFRLDPRDGFPGLVLPGFLRLELVLRGSPFGRDLLLLAVDPLDGLRRVGDLELETDDDFSWR